MFRRLVQIAIILRGFLTTRPLSDPLIPRIASSRTIPTLAHTRYLARPRNLREAVLSIIAFHLKNPEQISRSTVMDLAQGDMPSRASAIASIERSVPFLFPVISEFIDFFYTEASYLRDCLEKDLAYHHFYCFDQAPVPWRLFLDKVHTDVTSITEALEDSKISRSLGSDVLTRRQTNTPGEAVYWEVVAPLVHGCEVSRRLKKSLPSGEGVPMWRFLTQIETHVSKLEQLICAMAQMDALGLADDCSGQYRPYRVKPSVVEEVRTKCPDRKI